MTGPIVILTAVLALGVQAQQQQTPPPPAVPVPAPQQADAAKAVMFTGCVVAAVDREDTFQLVPAEPDPARPVGTSGTTPAWTVPAYLLLGGTISFAEHANKLVEITGTIEPAGAVPAADPKKAGDTTQRAAQDAAPVARLHVQSAKVVAATCTPKKQPQGR